MRMENKSKTTITPLSVDEQGMCRGGFISGDINSDEFPLSKNKGESCTNKNCSSIKNKAKEGCKNTNCDCDCFGEDVIIIDPNDPFLS